MSYVQVLSGFVNKKTKEQISELEEVHYDLHEDEWEARKFSVSDWRVLLAHWNLEAYNSLHELYRDLIVKSFQQAAFY